MDDPLDSCPLPPVADGRGAFLRFFDPDAVPADPPCLVDTFRVCLHDLALAVVRLTARARPNACAEVAFLSAAELARLDVPPPSAVYAGNSCWLVLRVA